MTTDRSRQAPMTRHPRRSALMPCKEWLNILRRVARNQLSGASRGRRCALLIDGDNVPPRMTGALVHYASGLGRVEIVDVFANFSSTTSTGWAVQMREHGMTGFQHYRTSSGKNAADTALIVKAMDLLHTCDIDDYVLVSSDSDFAALAHRLRRAGSSVHGIGSSNSAVALRQSCTTFLTFSEVSELAISSTAHVAPGFGSRPPRDAEDRLLLALVRLGGARGWVGFTELGEELRKSMPSFDPRLYSRRTLTDLCSAIDSIEVERSIGNPRARIALGLRNGAMSAGTSKS